MTGGAAWEPVPGLRDGSQDAEPPDRPPDGPPRVRNGLAADRWAGEAQAASVDEALDLVATWGTHRYDEVVTQLAHALQTAALARRGGAGDALVAAALLHDVGHLLEIRDRASASGRGDVAPAPGEGDLRHEVRGARWLESLFPPAVTDPIRLHVAAKRYRCAVDPTELSGLSAGSVASLARQGGPMAPDEVARFESDPRHRDAVSLRGWDDAGKVDGLEVSPLEDYRDLLRHLAST